MLWGIFVIIFWLDNLNLFPNQVVSLELKKQKIVSANWNWCGQLVRRSRSIMKWMVSLSESKLMCLSSSLHLLRNAGERVNRQVTQVDFKPQSENGLMKLYCIMFSEVIWKSFNHLIWLYLFFLTLSFRKILVEVKESNFSVLVLLLFASHDPCPLLSVLWLKKNP